jgi:hypothetical protein
LKSQLEVPCVSDPQPYPTAGPNKDQRPRCTGLPCVHSRSARADDRNLLSRAFKEAIGRSRDLVSLGFGRRERTLKFCADGRVGSHAHTTTARGRANNTWAGSGERSRKLAAWEQSCLGK